MEARRFISNGPRVDVAGFKFLVTNWKEGCKEVSS
jgi:hypothetical protein